MVLYLNWQERTAHNRGHFGSTPNRTTNSAQSEYLLRQPGQTGSAMRSLPLRMVRFIQRCCQAVKAAAFEAAIRWFDSSHLCQMPS